MAPVRRALLALLLVSGGVRAQDVVDPAEAEEPVVEPEAEASEPEPAAAPTAETPKPPPAPEPSLEERRIHQLRQLEARLSVGQPLTDDERRLLGQVARRGETPRARALAAAILPWLPPEEAAGPLLAAVDDEDARVRDQALLGLVAVGRRLPADVAARAVDVTAARLDDESAEVACTAARALAALDGARATRELSQRASAAEDVRYACWRRVVPMPERALDVPPPPEPGDDELSTDDEPDGDPPPPPAVAPPPPPPTGNLLFLSTATATGFLAGGLLPGLFWPPRDTLTYTARGTRHAREEASIGLATSTALAGALITGGAALAATTFLDPLELPAGTSTVVGVAAGAFAGLGTGMTFGLDGGLTGLSTIGGALTGLTLSSALAYTLPPTPQDIGFAVGLGANAALLTTLVSLAAVPVGVDLVIGDSRRVDFALGTGMLAGGVLTTGGLLLAPLLDVAPGRVLVASAAGASAAGIGLGLTYLFTPVAVDVRERIASGVGAGLHLLATTATFALLPGSWADAVLPSDGGPPATTALFLDDGELRLGIPVVTVAPSVDGRMVTSLPVLGGRF